MVPAITAPRPAELRVHSGEIVADLAIHATGRANGLDAHRADPFGHDDRDRAAGRGVAVRDPAAATGPRSPHRTRTLPLPSQAPPSRSDPPTCPGAT